MFWKNRFARDTQGSMTVEMVIWLPLVFALLMGGVDLTMLFYKQQMMYDHAYTASRQVSLGQKTDAEAQTGIVALYPANEGYQVSVISTEGYVTSTITAPFADLTTFTGVLIPGTLTAKAMLWIEAIEDDGEEAGV